MKKILLSLAILFVFFGTDSFAQLKKVEPKKEKSKKVEPKKEGKEEKKERKEELDEEKQKN